MGRVSGLDRSRCSFVVAQDILSRKEREKEVAISAREVNGGSEGDCFPLSKVFILDQR